MKANPDVRSAFYLAAITVPPALKPATAHYTIYKRPVSNRMIRMSTTTPAIPLGPYPQPLLYPHVGRAPMRARIKIMRRMVPIDIIIAPRCG
jgi:hypothetical protein